MTLESHQARKRFGQNFLVDQAIISRIVRVIAPRSDQHIVEIGPGQGALTEPLLASGAKLDLVELDRDLIPILRRKFAGIGEFDLHQADALKFDFATLAQDQPPLRIVGNLPYNISTPLIFHLLSFGSRVHDMHFMLQKEVVQRLAAEPGNKTYGRLSVMCQYHCQVENLFAVPPDSFEPQPKVESAIVRLIPHETLPEVAQDPRLLDQIVKAAFGQRRKTLRNALRSLVSSEQLQQAEVDLQQRPENLSVAGYVRLANFLSRTTTFGTP